MQEAWCDQMIACRGNGYADVESLAERTGLPQRALRLLADADCFRSIDIDRRNALWTTRRIPDAEALPLFAAARASDLADEPDAQLPAMALAEHVAADYQTAHLSLKGHPMGCLRPIFQAEGIASCAETNQGAHGAWIKTAGVVLVRQRPGKGNAIFITLEDESGIVNVVLWARQFEKFRREVMGARLMLVEGRVQKSPEGVSHLMAVRIYDRTSELHRLSETHATAIELAPADEFLNPPVYPHSSRGHPRSVRVLPTSRDFH
jgi:error-prone DNA polymerase